MNQQQCQSMCDALNESHFRGFTKMVDDIEPDYFAVYVQRSAKDRPNFLLNVHAKSKADALRIARAHGHTLPRWSYAVRIGKSGYFASLARDFQTNQP